MLGRFPTRVEIWRARKRTSLELALAYELATCLGRRGVHLQKVDESVILKVTGGGSEREGRWASECV